jgi:hypothetical protein
MIQFVVVSPLNTPNRDFYLTIRTTFFTCLTLQLQIQIRQTCHSGITKIDIKNYKPNAAALHFDEEFTFAKHSIRQQLLLIASDFNDGRAPFVAYII